MDNKEGRLKVRKLAIVALIIMCCPPFPILSSEGAYNPCIEEYRFTFSTTSLDMPLYIQIYRNENESFTVGVSGAVTLTALDGTTATLQVENIPSLLELALDPRAGPLTFIDPPQNKEKHKEINLDELNPREISPEQCQILVGRIRFMSRKPVSICHRFENRRTNPIPHRTHRRLFLGA